MAHEEERFLQPVPQHLPAGAVAKRLWHSLGVRLISRFALPFLTSKQGKQLGRTLQYIKRPLLPIIR